MDRTDDPLASSDRQGAPPEISPGPAPPARSQSKLSPILLWVLLAALLFRVVTSLTDGSGRPGGLVRWTDPQQAAAASRTAGKPILYDFTAEWCGPCKMLDRDGWGDRKIAALVNDAYVPTRVTDRAREDGRNAPWVDELHRRYQVGAFPTLVIAWPDGTPIAVVQGWVGREKLVTFLESSRRSR